MSPPSTRDEHTLAPLTSHDAPALRRYAALLYNRADDAHLPGQLARTSIARFTRRVADRLDEQEHT